eukprot:365604-Chlamydomonas_euryale.AAC.10
MLGRGNGEVDCLSSARICAHGSRTIRPQICGQITSAMAGVTLCLPSVAAENAQPLGLTEAEMS